jgi:hypothetical protein
VARGAPSSVRTRALATASVAIVAAGLLAAAPAALADVSSPVFEDTIGDRGPGGLAVDLISNQITHSEGDAGTAADDRLLFTSVLDNGGNGARFFDGDVVGWYLNTDGNSASGGFRGSEVVIALIGQPGGAEPVVRLQRWNGTSFTTVRALGPGEVLISPIVSGTLGAVGIQLPRADVGIARGATLGLVQSSDWLPNGDEDNAPDAGQYTLAIPRTPEAPAVGPAAAAVATESSLTFAASVDPRGLATTYRFEYGATTAYGSQTSVGDAGAGSGAAVVTATATGLAPGTAYNYRVVATNAAGTSLGPNQTATTAVAAPVAQTGQATATGPRTARLTGMASTRGRAGTAYFQWGTSRARLARRTPSRPVNGDGVPVRANLTRLAGGRSYHYRLVVEIPGARAVGQTLAVRTRPDNQILADVGAPLGLIADSRLYLRSLVARIRVVNPATGRTVRARSALRRARVDVQCTRGCSFSRGFRLGARRVVTAPIAGSAADFNRAGSGSAGARVALRVPRAGSRVTLNLLPLFTNGRGAPYLFRQGAEVVVRLSGPGLTPSATKIIVSSNARKLRCSVRGGRAVACRAS